jgi:hypothetical protein
MRASVTSTEASEGACGVDLGFSFFIVSICEPLCGDDRLFALAPKARPSILRWLRHLGHQHRRPRHDSSYRA